MLDILNIQFLLQKLITFTTSNIDINIMSSNSSSSSSVESYPPTLEDLRKSFLALHPEYEFGPVQYSSGPPFIPTHYGPIDPISKGGMFQYRGTRCQEWIGYINIHTKILSEEAGVPIPSAGYNDPERPLQIAESQFLQLCKNKALTIGARLEREKYREEVTRSQRERKDRQDKELSLAKEWAAKTGWKSQGEPLHAITSGLSVEDMRVIGAYRTAIRHSNRISTFASKTSLMEQEAEAILAYFIPVDNTYSPDANLGFKKDTLLALKVLNRFATEHKIRVEDAITVFREYIS
jgi:hypothetical protein